MTDRYILIDDKPVPCKNLIQWGRWLEKANRHVGLDQIDDIRVSTVFLGLNHRFYGKGDPILFETMFFGGPLDQHMFRSTTTEYAKKAHQKAAQLATLITDNKGTPWRRVKSKVLKAISLSDFDLLIYGGQKAARAYYGKANR